MSIHSRNITLLQEPAQTANSGWNSHQLSSDPISDRGLDEGHCKLSPAEDLFDSGRHGSFSKLNRPIFEDAVKVPRKVFIEVGIHHIQKSAEIVDPINHYDRSRSRSVGFCKLIRVDPIAFGEEVGLSPPIMRHQRIESWLEVDDTLSNLFEFLKCEPPLDRDMDMSAIVVMLNNLILFFEKFPRRFDMASPWRAGVVDEDWRCHLNGPWIDSSVSVQDDRYGHSFKHPGTELAYKVQSW